MKDVCDRDAGFFREVSIWLTVFVPQFGAERMAAKVPATWGVAIEVPDLIPKDGVGLMEDVMFEPGANKSVVAEMLESSATPSVFVELATEMAEETQPGKDILLVWPSLPAAMTVATFRPRSASMTVLKGAPRPVSQFPVLRSPESPMLRLTAATVVTGEFPTRADSGQEIVQRGQDVRIERADGIVGVAAGEDLTDEDSGSFCHAMRRRAGGSVASGDARHVRSMIASR